jgi:transcriptional regulator with XRE-family HTH domain
MGKAIGGVPEAPPLRDDGGSRGKDGIGAYLASQRKLRGISLEELATTTRIPRRSLERLEAGVFDDQPDGFVRGFVRTVAAAIGLDPDATVTRMLAEPLPRPGVRLPDPRRVAAVAVGVVLAGLLGLLLMRGLPAWRRSGSDGRPPQIYRRDAVRALAEARGIVGPQRAPAPADATRP